jgi:Icc-related predicted phosphoesterase
LLSEFKKSLKFLKKTLKKFANKKVIVIVHHCVSKKAIVEKYLNYRYSNMVISELDKFFTKFDNIKLIVHGHTHASVNYQLGNIKVYCNPLGRHNENPFFNKNLFIDV